MAVYSCMSALIHLRRWDEATTRTSAGLGLESSILGSYVREAMFAKRSSRFLMITYLMSNLSGKLSRA